VHAVAPLAHALHADRPAALGELQRVAEQIDEDLLERLGIGVDLRQLVERLHLEPHALALGERPRAVDDPLRHLRHAHRLAPDRELLALDLREIEEIVDQLQQPQAVALHRLEVAALHLGDRAELPAEHRLDGRQRERQRRAQLVVDVRGEATLRGVELLQLVARALDLAALEEVGEAHAIEKRACDNTLRPGCKRKHEVQ
jgi:hypothetical protein